MNKKIFIFAIVASLVPFAAGAQLGAPNGNNTPGPVNDLFNTIKKIQLPSINGRENAAGGNSLNLGQGTGVTTDVGNVWQNVNNWFSANIGVSLANIITVAVNFMIWIWELVIKLLQVGLSYL